MKLTERSTIMELNKKLFEDVVIYSMAEPGAMGAYGMMAFVTETGEMFDLNYFDDDTKYSKIKDNFPALKDCYWNGPMAEQKRNGVIFYGDNPDSCKHTEITKGWKHIYMGFGNHLVVREDKYEVFLNAINDLKTEIEIYDKWMDRAIKLFSGINILGDN